jgi:hypothetical protein
VDFEELSTYLQRLSLERERLLHPGQHSGHGGPSLTDFMADKMGEFKGNNLTQTRRERLTRLHFKLEEVSIRKGNHCLFLGYSCLRLFYKCMCLAGTRCITCKRRQSYFLESNDQGIQYISTDEDGGTKTRFGCLCRLSCGLLSKGKVGQRWRGIGH